MKNRDDLKIILLQIRDDPKVRLEENQSFADYSKLNLRQIDILNVFDTPDFSFKDIQDYDALFVGGASEASVLEPEKYPFVPCGIQLLKDCINQSFPVFASCFGFQLAVLSLGGEVFLDKENFEMGTILIQCTEEAENDILFYDIKNEFMAVSVHQERSLELPQSCILLAKTDLCAHVFKIKEKPFWAFQFHPEVDKARLVERLGIYQEKYTKSNAHYLELVKSFQEVPKSNELVEKFVDRVLLKS